MKALQCVELAGPEKLIFSEIEDPKPGNGEVLIEIKAASVNFPDVLMIQGLYQNQPPMPFIPGAECSGVIIEIGEGVNSCAVGDRVFVMAGTGCFAEKLVVEATRIASIPSTMDFPVAAALPMTYGTSLYALKQRANLQPGETLLVLGAAGGVGISAIEIGKAMGAKVIAAASSEEKTKICLEHEFKAIKNAYIGAKMFGIKDPIIAVAALNPHAGEMGLFGNEEKVVIEPAIELAKEKGIDARGPFPGDTVFMNAKNGHYDIVVAQYHDQGLIPIKYEGIDKGVNITVGIDFIRTSPDHGTAFDIAGKNLASPESFINAINTANLIKDSGQYPTL